MSEIEELKRFFESQKLPKELRLNSAEVIKDVPKFIESHLTTVAGNIGIPAFSSFYERLIKLKEALTK